MACKFTSSSTPKEKNRFCSDTEKSIPVPDSGVTRKNHPIGQRTFLTLPFLTPLASGVLEMEIYRLPGVPVWGVLLLHSTSCLLIVKEKASYLVVVRPKWRRTAQGVIQCFQTVLFPPFYPLEYFGTWRSFIDFIQNGSIEDSWPFDDLIIAFWIYFVRNKTDVCRLCL